MALTAGSGRATGAKGESLNRQSDAVVETRWDVKWQTAPFESQRRGWSFFCAFFKYIGTHR